MRKKIRFSELARVKRVLRKLSLKTVCESSGCPNITECFSKYNLTFMLLGSICTRACKFCRVKPGKPNFYDLHEPKRVAEAVCLLGVKYAIITSVTRDDLEDGGASIFANTIRKLKRIGVRTEALVPEIKIEPVLEAEPEILAHNIETVPRLYPVIRPHADFERSLRLLEKASNFTLTKSSIIVGFGETSEEVLDVIKTLKDVGCKIITIGQYFQPSKTHFPVVELVPEWKFKFYEEEGRKLGLKVMAGRFVRSSYMAELVYEGVHKSCQP